MFDFLPSLLKDPTTHPSPHFVTNPAISLGTDHHSLIVALREFIRHDFNLVLPEKHAQNSLDLHEREGLPHAGMHPPPEAEVGEGRLVLLPRRSVAVGVEGVSCESRREATEERSDGLG